MTGPDTQDQAFSALTSVRYDIIEQLSAAVSSSDAPFRTPIVSTVDAEGAPQARIMVLRAFDPDLMLLRFFTDSRSPKFSELKANPKIQLVFYDGALRLHMRVSGRASLHEKNMVTDGLWSQLPEFGRGDYLTQQAPGTEIPDPSQAWPDESMGSDNFALIDVKINEVDWLKLSRSGHKRAWLSFANGDFKGRWITP